MLRSVPAKLASKSRNTPYVGRALRGKVRHTVFEGNAAVIDAQVPLKEMFGYISHLRSMTKGRASFTMQFHHYDPVPRNVADEIMKASA